MSIMCPSSLVSCTVSQTLRNALLQAMPSFLAKRGISKTISSVLFVFVANTAFAQNEVANEAARLLKAGQIDAASAKVEAGLASTPKEPQLRFLRGVIQIEQRKNTEAINTFLRLVEDYPELPEPYNNLAVLYGGMGQYDKARAALELAIRTHPSYATAHENLGDVYTKLASESYNRALQLDGANNAAQFKLNVIKDLSSGKQVKPSGGTLAAAPAVAATPLASAAPVKPVPAAAPVQTAPVAAPVAAAPVAVLPAPVAKPAPVAAASNVAPADKTEVLTAVNNWSKAWSARNVDAYLGMYGKSFAVPGGEGRKAWEQERRSRIEGKKSISVRIDGPEVKIDGNTATVSFKQLYKADALDTSTRKTLVLQKASEGWKIVSEKTGR